MKKFKPNRSGIDKVFQQVSERLEAADAAIRAEHTGRPAEEIVESAKVAFAEAGVNIPESAVGDYAESVSKNEPFRFDVG